MCNLCAQIKIFSVEQFDFILDDALYLLNASSIFLQKQDKNKIGFRSKLLIKNSVY